MILFFLFSFILSRLFFFLSRGKLGMCVSDAMRQRRCYFERQKASSSQEDGLEQGDVEG